MYVYCPYNLLNSTNYLLYLELKNSPLLFSPKLEKQSHTKKFSPGSFVFSRRKHRTCHKAMEVELGSGTNKPHIRTTRRNYLTSVATVSSATSSHPMDGYAALLVDIVFCIKLEPNDWSSSKLGKNDQQPTSFNFHECTGMMIIGP